jgi:hypothetical protein
VSRWLLPKTNDQDRAEWSALFTAYTRSAYRLEGQQIYSSPEEDADVRLFLAGKPVEVELYPALASLRAQVAAGRTKTRVRVVVEPPTDYTRFELSVYPEFVAAGEDIRIIAVPKGEWPASLPEHDYWLFDDHDVWRMHYNEDYTFHGAEQIEDQDAIVQYLQWRDIALAQAVPLESYLASRKNE